MYGKKKFFIRNLIIIILLLSMTNVVCALSPEDFSGDMTAVLNIKKDYSRIFPDICSITTIILGLICLLIMKNNKKYKSLTKVFMILNLIFIIIRIFNGEFFDITYVDGIMAVRNSIWTLIFGLLNPITLIAQIIITICIIKNKMKAKKEGEKQCQE